MKRNDWLLILAVSFYSFLFYRQSAGINFVIFNFVLLGCLTLKDVKITTSKKWLLAALGNLASSLCVGYYGNALSVVANVISLSLLSALSMDKDSSVIVSLIYSCYSYCASPIYIILDSIERSNKQENGHPNYWKRIMLIGIPIIITLIFFFLYRASNPVFDKLAEKINFDFISIDWIIFTLIGFILLYGFFFQKQLQGLSIWDKRPTILEKKEYSELNLLGKKLNLNDENLSGIILFVLLNALLFVVNLGDVNYLFITHKLPEGLTDSEFVHQGINALIASIIIAIAIVLFYFRGGLNFFAKSKAIKILACIWVLQNAFMIYSTSCRNTLYISEWGLTYKRIGVYIYLMLALTGLVTTLVKIIKAKSNNFLFRINGWIFYAFLILLSFPNWATLVTNYNVHHGKVDESGYVFNLSNSNIPDLLPLYNAAKNKKPIESVGRYIPCDSLRTFSVKLYKYLVGHDTLDWRSWYYEDLRVYNDVSSPDFINAITVIDLSHSQIRNPSLSPLFIYNRLTNLNVATTEIKSIKEVADFPLLEKLDISNNPISDLKGIEKLQHLKSVNLSGLHIINYSPLYQIPNLETLDISSCALGNIEGIIKLANLKELNLGNNSIADLSGIENMKNLESLKLTGNVINDYSPLYKLPNLRELYVRRYWMQDSIINNLAKNLPNAKIIAE